MRPASKGDLLWHTFPPANYVLSRSRLYASRTGQTTIATGSIQGTVTDLAGAVLPWAKVTITGKATGQVITATKRAAGAIVIADLTRPDFGDAVRPSHGAGLDQLARAGL